jgi:disulfide bond formation protein DsbB
MRLLNLDTYTRNIRPLGAFTIAICILTWALDLNATVYACPYCRVQRTVIGILGLIMLLPNPGHWLARYMGSVLAVLGLSVAASQHFHKGWMKIINGEFSFYQPWYFDAFILSGVSLFIISAQILLLFSLRACLKPGQTH